MSFHRPAMFAGHEFSAFEGASDPAAVSALAHESASLLLAQVKDAPTAVIDRAVELTDEHGLDLAAELWSQTGAHSLPGSLWRLYLVRAVIREQDAHMSHLYAVGNAVLHTADHVVAGAPTPAGPAEIRELADQILRGAFAGDYGHALERAAAFCRVTAAGCIEQAHENDATNADLAAALTTQGARLSTIGSELDVCARLWRSDNLV